MKKYNSSERGLYLFVPVSQEPVIVQGEDSYPMHLMSAEPEPQPTSKSSETEI